MFKQKPAVLAYAAVVGKKEKEGPLGESFPFFENDTTLGVKTWEQSETKLLSRAMREALIRAGKEFSDISMTFGGDLQAQCTASGYAARAHSRPFAGLYGACSTMALSLFMAASFVNAGYAETAMASTSSHFCSAERQFRFPLEYGGQRCPTSQWTVTGAGSCILGSGSGLPYVAAGLLGRVVDLGVTDINNMGAAMAPAAADTIERFLNDTDTSPGDYDVIATGDLGSVGSEIMLEMLKRRGIKLSNHADCGRMIYDPESGVGAGGSGCGCSASVLCGCFLPKLESGEYKNIILCSTGALMSTATFQQGESIPGIAHLVNIRK